MSSQLKSAKNRVVRVWTMLRALGAPRDGKRRYFYDTWQRLAVLVLTSSFTMGYFITKDPYPTTTDLFYCNADGNVQMLETGGYKPFWDPNLFFAINLPAGENLTFTQAKLIDAAWDLGVRRGGQILAALVAYRVLRRSLTLVMESSTITIPTVVSVCCQQMNILTSWHMLRDVFSTRSSQRFPGKRLSFIGRRRLSMQLFACIYVLVFPTLTSVMTGYRTGFEGIFDYHPGSVSEVKPLAKVGHPRMTVEDGGRVGLPYMATYVAHQVPNLQTQSLNMEDFLLSSEYFEEPAGVLVDYYFTCLGVMRATQMEQIRANIRGLYERPLTLACATHNCSCSISGTQFGTQFHTSELPRILTLGFYYPIPSLLTNATSDITIRGTQISLSAPPLGILVTLPNGPHGPVFTEPGSSGDYPIATSGMKASDYWSSVVMGLKGITPHPVLYDYEGSGSLVTLSFDGAGRYLEEYALSSGICVANEGCSWGFSSLLLLTLCTYTILFATTLIMLQSEVYQLSRFDRCHQTYSIYADILTIVEALNSVPEYNMRDLFQSPKALGKELEKRNHGIRFDAQSLSPSRWSGYETVWEAHGQEDRLEDELLSDNEGGVHLQAMEPVTENPDSVSTTAEQKKAKDLALID